MTDDFSNVPSGGCNVFSSSSTLYHYSQNVRSTFLNFGGKWVKTSTSSYYTIPDGYECVDISAISSNSYWEPVYMAIAFSLVVATIGLFWYVIRRLLLWRI